MLNLSKISKELAECSVQTMEHSGYKAKIMCAKRLKGDTVFGLPPGNPFNVIPIHCLPACPESWIRESGSYVIPIDTEDAMWFDWTDNDVNTAIIPSVKGMNPLNGLKLEQLRMEQYRDKCPKHDISFAHGRYCEKCGHSWTPQNYVSHPNILWLDGWLQPDGSVRQFFFTEDDKRDIASLVIGKENTVPAFGFAFFKTKVNRVVERNIVRGMQYGGDCFGMQKGLTADWTVHTNDVTYDSGSSLGLLNCTFLAQTGTMHTNSTGGGTSTKCCNTASANSIVTSSCYGETTDSLISDVSDDYSRSVSSKAKKVSAPVNYSCDDIKIIEGDEFRSKKLSRAPNKEVAVGAGARINQKLEVDKLALGEYIETPQSLVRLYFVFEDQLKDILDKGGIKELRQNGGFMKNLPVG